MISLIIIRIRTGCLVNQEWALICILGTPHDMTEPPPPNRLFIIIFRAEQDFLRNPKCALAEGSVPDAHTLV